MLCSSSLMNCLLKSSPMAPRIRLSRSLAQNYCSQQPSTSAADQKQRPTSHKRFYESVNIVKRLSSADPNVAADHDLVIGKRMTLVSNSPQSIYEVHLDGRPLRTPASKTFRTFSEPLALAVAHEWASQESQLHRDLMCLTGLSFTSLDNPFGGSKESVVKDTIEFLDTDTILYFANRENSLFDEQQRSWRPIICWANERYGLDLRPSESVSEPLLPDESRSRLSKMLMCYNYPALIGLNHAVGAVKSLLLSLACIYHRLEAEEAVKLARLEQLYQTRIWGHVEWGHGIEEQETCVRFSAGVLFFNLCSNTEDHVDNEHQRH